MGVPCDRLPSNAAGRINQNCQRMRSDKALRLPSGPLETSLVVYDGSSVRASTDTRVRNGRCRHANHVDEYGNVLAARRHVSLEHLHGIGQVVALQHRVLEYGHDLMEHVAF